MEKENTKIDARAYWEEFRTISPSLLKEIKESTMQKQYREYLAELRGLSFETMETTYMYYELEGDFIELLLPNPYHQEIMGLVRANNSVYRERFIFPILNHDYTILGWVGYDWEHPIKYLFSFGTVGAKENVFYNMQNIREVYRKGYALVEEGIIDSIRLNELNYKNNLSLCGSRLTEYHSRVLNRLDLVITLPDNDDSGKLAAKYWRRDIKTKHAMIDIQPVMIGEDKQVKDIDDALKDNPSRQEEFDYLIKTIVKDSKSRFFKEQTYKF